MNLNQGYQEKLYVPPSSIAVKATIDEILTLAEKKIQKKRKDMVVLDVGSGHGIYSKYLAKNVKKVIGVEPYLKAYNASLKFQKKDKIKFHNIPVEDLKTQEKFDVVVCLTIIEHMPNQKKSLQKIHSLMNKNSIMYLTAPNKLWPVESHYGLLFLSWLPLPLANIYMRIVGKGDSYEDSSYSKTYFGLISLLERYKWKFEFFVPPSDAPYLGCGYDNLSPFYENLKNIGIILIKHVQLFWVFSKGFIVIVHKK
jgi:SAM-dependent methyltransferase